MNIILTMLFSGSAVYLLFVFFIRLSQNLLSAKHRFLILKINLSFFLIPYGLAAGRLWGMAADFADGKGGMRRLFRPTMAVYMTTPNGVYVNKKLQIQLMLVLIWFIVFCCVIAIQLIKYNKVKKKIFSLSSECHDTDLNNILELYRKKIGIRREIKIYLAKVVIEPFAFGVVKPIIVIPKDLQPENFKMVIWHEMIHIKRFDAFFKFSQMLATGMYWYNPIIWLLRAGL